MHGNVGIAPVEIRADPKLRGKMRHSPRVRASKLRMVSRSQDSSFLLLLKANSVPKVGRVSRITEKQNVRNLDGTTQF